jgi:hypothetical protein
VSTPGWTALPIPISVRIYSVRTEYSEIFKSYFESF